MHCWSAPRRFPSSYDRMVGPGGGRVCGWTVDTDHSTIKFRETGV
jgi:hypothetical protein